MVSLGPWRWVLSVVVGGAGGGGLGWHWGCTAGVAGGGAGGTRLILSSVLLPVLAWEIGSHAVGENATPHENERVRKVLVQKDPNTRIGMGDERRKFIQFKLEWHQDRTQTAKALKNYKALEDEILDSGRKEARIRTFWNRTIHKAIDAESGRFHGRQNTTTYIQEHQSKGGWRMPLTYALKREVEDLSEF